MNSNYNIDRFIIKHNVMFETALSEIKNERKLSHWMWYIFPQLRFLGRSETALYYGIKDAGEAKAFYDNAYLGGNLREICEALLECKTDNSVEIFGYVDSIKLCSSMTLFYLATDDDIFKKVVDKFYGGKFDELTVDYYGKNFL